MLTKKKKLSKKEIKEDKLVESYYKAYGFIEENKKTIALYALGLVAVIGLVFWYMSYKNSQNEKAAFALSRVMPLYDAGSYLEAVEGRAGQVTGLKKIVEEYGSTESGEIAKIYLANSYSLLGKPEQAFKYYEDYSGGNDLFKASAYAGQADYYAGKKDHEKAADLYMKASKVSDTNVLNGDYLLHAGIEYLAAGKNDKAKEVFDDIRDNYETSSASRELEKYLPLVGE